MDTSGWHPESDLAYHLPQKLSSSTSSTWMWSAMALGVLTLRSSLGRGVQTSISPEFDKSPTPAAHHYANQLPFISHSHSSVIVWSPLEYRLLTCVLALLDLQYLPHFLQSLGPITCSPMIYCLPHLHSNVFDNLLNSLPVPQRSLFTITRTPTPHRSAT